MKLKCTDKKVIMVEYEDLNKFIERVFGHKFCFISDWGAYNNSLYEFDVTGRDYDWDADKDGETYGPYYAKFIKEGQNEMEFNHEVTRGLLDNMCWRKLIKPGHYIIKVWY